MKCGLAGNPSWCQGLRRAYKCLFVKKGPEGATQSIQHTWKDGTRGIGKWQKVAGLGQGEGYPS